MGRSEKLTEPGDSWFSAKSMAVEHWIGFGGGGTQPLRGPEIPPLPSAAAGVEDAQARRDG